MYGGTDNFTIVNMEHDLILEKADIALQGLTCTKEAKEQLKKFIVEIVSYHMALPNQRSIYKILTQKEGKSERTILNYASKALADIVLDSKTRKTLKGLGVEGEVTSAKLLKAVAKEVQREVRQEQKKHKWIGLG